MLHTSRHTFGPPLQVPLRCQNKAWSPSEDLRDNTGTGAETDGGWMLLDVPVAAVLAGGGVVPLGLCQHVTP